MGRKDNPYNWSSDRPRHVVRREKLLNEVVDNIQRGQSGFLIGCRGMGKSAFLRQLEDALRGPSCDLLVFPTPGLQRNVQGAIQAIANEMERLSQPRASTESFPGKLQECARRLDLEQLSEVLETLRLATGGNLALATYGLQYLWPIVSPTSHDIAEIFGDFRDSHTRFLDGIRSPIFAEEAISNAPELVWREFLRTGGRASLAQVEQLVKQAKGKQRVALYRVFEMLRSTGLIRASHDTYRKSDINVEIISSILTLDVPEEPNRKDSIREQLVADLCNVLASIHRMALDFYRGEKGQEKEILPEAVFSAALVLGLEPRGWKTEREAQSAAGRTDIKARHDRFGAQCVVVEVKIWGRNDYAKIHEQVTSYWSEGVAALATVMITDQQSTGWAEKYAEKCFKDNGLTPQPQDPPPTLAGHFVARAEGCKVEEVDHFLLRLARRS